MKTTFAFLLLFSFVSLSQAETIDDAIKSAPLLDAPGSKTPLGKSPTTATILEEKESADKTSLPLDQQLLKRIEHLETENAILLDRIKVIEHAYSDLTKKVQALEKKVSTASPRRIIRPDANK